MWGQMRLRHTRVAAGSSVDEQPHIVQFTTSSGHWLLDRLQFLTIADKLLWMRLTKSLYGHILLILLVKCLLKTVAETGAAQGEQRTRVTPKKWSWLCSLQDCESENRARIFSEEQEEEAPGGLLDNSRSNSVSDLLCGLQSWFHFSVCIHSSVKKGVRDYQIIIKSKLRNG